MSILAQRLGRRVTLFLISGLLALTGSTIMSLAFVFDAFEALALGRVFAGLSGGVVSSVLGIYFAEVCPNRFRGLIGSTQALQAKARYYEAGFWGVWVVSELLFRQVFVFLTPLLCQH